MGNNLRVQNEKHQAHLCVFNCCNRVSLFYADFDVSTKPSSICPDGCRCSLDFWMSAGKTRQLLWKVCPQLYIEFIHSLIKPESCSVSHLLQIVTRGAACWFRSILGRRKAVSHQVWTKTPTQKPLKNCVHEILHKPVESCAFICFLSVESPSCSTDGGILLFMHRNKRKLKY